jgi:hypothetical protein
LVFEEPLIQGHETGGAHKVLVVITPIERYEAAEDDDLPAGGAV